MTEERISYKIMAHVGVLQKYATGWTKEANLISWNGGQPKLDIREWSPDHNLMSKGVTMSVDEAQKFMDAVGSRDVIGMLKDLSRQARSNELER